MTAAELTADELEVLHYLEGTTPDAVSFPVALLLHTPASEAYPRAVAEYERRQAAKDRQLLALFDQGHGDGDGWIRR